MRYENLNQLIRESSSSRRYFLSLPVSMQLKLHEHNDYIHTADELHRRTDAILKYERQVKSASIIIFNILMHIITLHFSKLYPAQFF